jgi:hypothetical protein
VQVAVWQFVVLTMGFLGKPQRKKERKEDKKIENKNCKTVVADQEAARSRQRRMRKILS